tara:strand:+ start:481 stop:933 length:453 start_codon:yes stop_codon:yes gene_type:complete
MSAESWKLPPGLNHVGAYQVSGRPFLSGACSAPASGAISLVIRFPAVTKWLQIAPHTGSQERLLRVAFSKNGLYGKGGSYIRLHASSSFCRPWDMKVSEVWFMSEDASAFEFDVMAGLTGIPSSRTNTTGSMGIVGAGGGPNWSGSTGVG